MVQLHHTFMLSSFPFNILISTTLLISTLIAISRANWLFAWLALEINIISFIPILIITQSNQETESAIKYFLIQALGSSILLIYSSSLWYSSIPSNIMPLLLIFRLLIKLGAAPFHPWFPQVISSTHWLGCFLLSTWQKLAPLLLTSFLFPSSLFLCLFASSTALFGGVLGINQTKLRSLIAYSSLVHLGWMIGLAYVNKPTATIIYFAIYSSIILPLFILFHSLNIKYVSYSSQRSSFNPLLPLFISLLLLSLSGIPPLTGFIPKWISITYLWISPNLLILLVIASLISTYYYLNLLFSSLISLPQTQTVPISPHNRIALLTLASSSLFMGPLLIY